MKIQEFDMKFRDEILEMAEIGVIKIADDGTILKTKFGSEVHDYMHIVENYEVKKIMLAREGSTPDDCAALVVIGPENELFSVELEHPL